MKLLEFVELTVKGLKLGVDMLYASIEQSLVNREVWL